MSYKLRGGVAATLAIALTASMFFIGEARAVTQPLYHTEIYPL